MYIRQIPFWILLLIASFAVWPAIGVAGNTDSGPVNGLWILPGGVGCTFNRALEDESDGGSLNSITGVNFDQAATGPKSTAAALPSGFNPLRDSVEKPIRGSGPGQPGDCPPTGLPTPSGASVPPVSSANESTTAKWQPDCLPQAAELPHRPQGIAPRPGDFDVSVLGQPSSRELDPLRAAMAPHAVANPPTVRLASQEDILPLPGGPGPAEVVPAPAPLEIPMEVAGLPTESEAIPPQRLEWLYRMAWGGNTHDPNHDRGIGYERVQFAPYMIETVLPMNQYGLRIDAAYHWRAPDLGELVTARPQSLGGMGPPLPEHRLNYQDIAFVSEIGTESASAKTIIPLRLLDGQDNGATDGMGDMELDTKLVLLKGEYIKIAQFMGCHFNTGYAPKGLGTGHISIEPGILASLKLSDETFFHTQCKFLFPTAANPDQKSNLLTWGFGLSHVLYDFDSFAVIPTLETVFYSVLNGQNIDPGPPPVFQGNDWVTIPTVHYGVRMMTDRIRDLGLVEFGLSGGFSVGSNVWYEDIVRAEVRVVF